MILNSIKWRLQAWHALMLIVVLSGFGFTAYQLDRVSRYQRIDRELQQRAETVMRALRESAGRPGPQRREDGPPGGPRDFEPPGPEGREFGPGPGPEGERPPPPREDRFEGQTPPTRGPRLADRDASMFTGTGSGAYYYILFHRSGDVLTKSDSAPENVRMPARGSNNVVRVRGSFREIVSFTPPGEAVVAGVDVSGEQAELRRLGWLLFGAGSGVLLLGLAGGWWMATRAIRPIQDISAAATKISAGDLSQRIASSETESELGQLAAILNSTFGRLESAFAQQQQFTSDAAHELRTPVSVILTQIQSTLNKERSSEEYRETLEACQRAAQRMRRLIESLLELARFDAGQEKLKCLPFDLAATARDCADLIQPLADGRQVKLETAFSPAPCAGDSERISQVITNLLTNAVNYNKPNGKVQLQVSVENGSAVVRVADTGQGISAEELPRVFERFYRGDKSRTNSAGSAGLGLSICQAIVEAHGGTIEVVSELERGTTFILRLPPPA